LMFSFKTVAAVMRCELESPQSCDVETAESRLESQFQELKRSAGGDASKENIIKKALDEAGVQIHQMSLSQGQSIDLIVTRQSVEELQQLRSYFESGLLKETLESIFTLLADIGEGVRIKELTWSLSDYNECLQQLESYKGIHSFVYFTSTLSSASQ
jgi:hypothetical protein